MKRTEDTRLFGWLCEQIDRAFLNTFFYEQAIPAFRLQVVSLLAGFVTLGCMIIAWETTYAIGDALPDSLLGNVINYVIVLGFFSGLLWCCWYITSRFFVLIGIFGIREGGIIAAAMMLMYILLLNLGSGETLNQQLFAAMVLSWSLVCFRPALFSKQS